LSGKIYVMKKILFCAALISLSALFLGAQEPNYELAARFSAERVQKMVYSTDIHPNWFKNSDKFWYEWTTAEGKNYYIVDPVAKTKIKVFDMESLARQISLITKEPYDAQHLPLKKLELKDDTKFTFEVTTSKREYA